MSRRVAWRDYGWEFLTPMHLDAQPPVVDQNRFVALAIAVVGRPIAVVGRRLRLVGSWRGNLGSGAYLGSQDAFDQGFLEREA